MTSLLDQLKKFTVVVADTGDLSAIAQLKPIDATTNPSLLLKAANLPMYSKHLKEALDRASGDLNLAADLFAVSVGQEILNLIPGRISTEVDARLSFDTQATVERAKRLMEYYQAAGTPSERILIKIAATWEGIQAAEQLERLGIQTNLTLVFSFAQAAACAEAGVHLISPFVGRIYDWYKKQSGQDYSGQDDPGVQSVQRIYAYYKAHQYPTVIMGASFRNLSQITALAGCDRLTISPELLHQLSAEQGALTPALSPNQTQSMPKVIFNEASFRWAMNEDAMATEKLAEGLRLFAKDQSALEQQLARL